MSLLIVDNLTKQHDEIDILNGINFALEPGESLAIMGRSGSGKSTLLNQIAGLDFPTSGGVFFNSTPIHKLPESELASLRGRKMGFVFQSFRLLDALTALENVCLPLELFETPHAIQIGMDWLEKLGLKEKGNQFPSTLSGGEQQRVAIARALVHKPELIIADEPTGNLDHRTSEKVGKILFESCKRTKTALILATHDKELAMKADHVMELFEGQLRAYSL